MSPFINTWQLIAKVFVIKTVVVILIYCLNCIDTRKFPKQVLKKAIKLSVHNRNDRIFSLKKQSTLIE